MTKDELDAIVARLRKGASDWFPQALELDLEKLVREAQKAETLRSALGEIAADVKVYTGHGNFEEEPMGGRECQSVARTALLKTSHG